MQTDTQTPWRMTLAVALAVAFAFQGSRGLFDTSEGRYAECAREMIESGNYLEPTLGYRPHWTKPPLTYWAIAAGVNLFGPNEWGVRLYNAACFALTTLIVAGIGAALFDRATGALAGLVYATSPFPMLGANAVTTDTLLALWSALAVFSYVRAARAQPGWRAGGWLAAMWLALGLGFLTKGPPSLLVLIPIVLWHRWHERGKRLANAAGLALFAVAGLSWYLIVIRTHPELLSYFLGHEVVGRVASESVHNHAWYRGVAVYVPVLTFGAGAWLFFGLRTVWEQRLFRLRALWLKLRANTPGAFLLLWLLPPLGIFLCVSSRLELYVLPLYAPLALAVARGIRLRAPHPSPGRAVYVTAIASAAVLITVKAAAAHVHLDRDMRSLYRRCLAAGGPQATYVLVNRPGLYGLQYYLGGRLTRVSITAGEPWADGRLARLLARIAKSAPPARYVLICDAHFAPNLRSLLTSRLLPFSCDQTRERAIFAVTP